jgi:antitoxin (DNA-binding transcriptional repressor) of toxin-antitoxin stability system
MYQVGLDEAKARLSDLIETAFKGEKVFIFKDDQQVVQLVPTEPPKRHPQFGSARGLIVLAEDFDAPLADLNEYMH